MKEKPILFSGPMVRAILAGRKRMTRRVCRVQGFDNVERYERYPDGSYRAIVWSHDESGSVKCPYGGPGDRLWVRETWACVGVGQYAYRATDSHLFPNADGWSPKWKPSIHMPRSISRLTLEVAAVRVERVQNITEEDAEAEGVRGMEREMAGGTDKLDPDSGLEHGMHCSPKLTFSFLWDHLNYDRGFGWYANPWVWVVEFEKVGRTDCADCAERDGEG